MTDGPDHQPWWCTTCEALIPASGLTHNGGEGHDLRRATADDPQPGPVKISFYRQTQWTEVQADHPSGFQWTGPGVYVIAVDRESNTQLAEIRITLAHDTDGNDNSTPMLLAIAHALRRVYSKEKP